MSKLPEGWVATKLTEVCTLNPAKPKSDQIASDLPVTFVPMAAVDAELGTIANPSIREYSAVAKGFTSFQENDVIMAKITPCMENGKAAIARRLSNGIGFGSTEFHVFRPSAAVLPEYVFHFIRQESFRKSAEANMTGSVGQKRVPASFLNEYDFPLPPLAEQRRIAAKLKPLLDSIDAYQQRFVKIPVILKRFRQAVLAAAYAGRLTAKWREEHADVEPASELLQRIKVKRLELAGSQKEKSQVLEAFAQEEYFALAEEVPSTWVSCQIGMIGAVVNGSTPSRKIPEYWGGNVHWVSSGEVRNNLIGETRECMTEEGYRNSSVKLLPSETVLLAMIGEGKTRGQTAILKIAATINQNVAAIILNHGLLVSEYLWRWFQFQYAITRESGSGSGPQALNCQRVRELPLYLPPLAEQNEIVRHVETLFKLAGQIEARYQRAKPLVDKLPQSILAKAFRGELVPTEAELARREGRDYEPASVLLERIRLGRAEHTQVRKEKAGSQPRRTRLARGAKPRV